MTAYLVAMGIQVGIYGLLALSLNLQWGYTGLLNFGQVAFFAAGAYGYAIATTTLGAPVVVGFAVAIASAVVIAFGLAWTSVRLTVTHYLAIVTLGASEILRAIITNEGWLTEGTRGIGVSRLVPGLDPATEKAVLLVCVLACVLLVYLVFERLGRAPFGRTIEAIRNNEAAALSIGKAVAWFKIKSFSLGAAVAGLAGAFFAIYSNFLVPDQFIPWVTFYIWMAMIIGGTGSHRGALVGAVLLVLFIEGSRFLKDILPIAAVLSDSRIAALRFIVVGLALILVPLYRPAGLLGRRSR